MLPYADTDKIYVSAFQVKICFLDIIANKLVLTHITALERHLLKKTPDPLMNQIIPLPRPLPRLYHKSRELPQASRKLTVPPGTHLQQHLVLVKPIDPDFSELSRVVVRSCGRAGRATRRCSAEDVVCSDNMSSLDARAIDSGSLPLPPWGGPPPPARAPSFRRNLPDQGHTRVRLRQ